MSGEDRLSYKIEFAVISLIRKTVGFIRSLEKDKILLHSKPDFSTCYMFQLIDQEGRGVIDHYDLASFLQRYGFVMDDLDIQMIVSSFDIKYDNLIDQQEFLFSVQPRHAVFLSPATNKQLQRQRHQLQVQSQKDISGFLGSSFSQQFKTPKSSLQPPLRFTPTGNDLPLEEGLDQNPLAQGENEA